MAKILIYPVKSCGPIELEAADVDALGFVGDRRWVVVDERNNFVSQRMLPSMALIKPKLVDGKLFLDAPGHSTLAVPAPEPSAPHVFVNLWGDVTETVLLSEACSTWLSSVLGRPVRLAHTLPPGQHHRPVDSKFDPTGKAHAAFSDGFPFLLLSQESVVELNKRLAKPVSDLNFRPNIVVQGCRAFEEDCWQGLLIAGQHFECVKPCSRCTVPTVDPATGKRDPAVEPLKTLRTFRAVNEAVMFGQNVIFHGASGRVRVGDTVTVTSTEVTPTAALSLVA